MQINRYTSYNNTSRRSASVQYIVVHYTGSGSSRAGNALANCKYFAGGYRGASADFFIDDSGIWQYNPDTHGRNTWAIGDGHGRYGKTNANSVSIEVCNNGGEYTATQKSYLQQLVRSLMSEFGVPADRVVRHWDCSRKCCPAPYAPNGEDPSGARWSALHALITGGGAIEASGSSWSGSAGAGDQVPRYIAEDGSGGPATMWLFEYQMGVRSGESKSDATMSGQARSDDRARPAWKAVSHGTGGSLSVRQLQGIVGVGQDGYWGRNTSIAVQRFLRAYGHQLDVDGSFGPRSMQVFQWAMNHGQLAATWMYDDSHGWWYALGNGGRATGWKQIGGSWYLFDNDGWMCHGDWFDVGGKRYALAGDGHMMTGWTQDRGKWYYLDGSGAMVHDCTMTIGGKPYTFGSDGAMQ